MLNRSGGGLFGEKMPLFIDSQGPSAGVEMAMFVWFYSGEVFGMSYAISTLTVA
jgi:hypothetical protein